MARTSIPSKAEPAERERTPFNWKPFAIAAVVVAAFAALIVLDPAPPGVEFPDQGNLHLVDATQDHVPYNSRPASSGPHIGGGFPTGVQADPVPEEFFVHTLEDGGVVFAYDCPDGCDDLVAELTTITEEDSRRLLTPYEGISNEGTEYRAAAVVWTRIFYFDELDEGTRSSLETFLSLYEGVDHHA